MDLKSINNCQYKITASSLPGPTRSKIFHDKRHVDGELIANVQDKIEKKSKMCTTVYF